MSVESPGPSPMVLTTDGGSAGPGVAVVADAGVCTVEVAAYGQWSAPLGERASAVVEMCLAGPCASIMVDLRDLDDPVGASLTFWLALWRRARLADTPVDLAFCLPTTAALSGRLRYLRGPQPRVYPTVSQGRAAIAKRSPRPDLLQASLAPRPASVGAARALVTRACHDWHRPDLLPDALLIVSELAANAVEHAATDLVVTVGRSGTRLHIAVHDGVSSFPHPSVFALAGAREWFEERGRGLRLVQAVADAWGVVPTRQGKAVWATVQ